MVPHCALTIRINAIGTSLAIFIYPSEQNRDSFPKYLSTMSLTILKVLRLDNNTLIQCS